MFKLWPFRNELFVDSEALRFMYCEMPVEFVGYNQRLVGKAGPPDVNYAACGASADCRPNCLSSARCDLTAAATDGNSL